MWEQEELLKCIWHAFTAFDVDHRGKVSKSQLEVLSVNLCAVMKISFDPCELEKHFKGEEPGSLSSQGYMPYLSNYILNKVLYATFLVAAPTCFHWLARILAQLHLHGDKQVQDNFDILELFKFCWTLSYKKKLSIQHLRISHDDAFKVWCIFNLLSESKYPLYIVTQEIEYLFKMLTSAMGDIWSGRDFTEYHLERNLHDTNSLTVWELIELVGMHLFKNKSIQTLSAAINEVFEELILGILKQGLMVKRYHKGKNWTEYWFVLRANSLEYYVSEDLMEIKGIVVIDSNCTVESLPDKDGKSCLFSIKNGDASFEVSVSDKVRKREWIKAIGKCIQMQKLGMLPPQRQAREERREQRSRQQAAEDKLEEQIKKLLVTNENKQRQLEMLEKRVEDIYIENKRGKTNLDLQDCFRLDLEKEKMMRLQVEEQVAQKSSELERSLLRVKELEDMYHSLQEALEDERQVKQDHEAKTELQARLLEEEILKRAELEQMHLHQQRALSQSQAQRQELEAQMQDQERRLKEATWQLERQRARADQHYQDVTRKLEHVANECNNNIAITRYEGLTRLIEPGHKGPHLITNWGPSAFTEGELEVRKRFWQKSKNWSAAAE